MDIRYQHLGKRSTKIIEECGELIQALCKYETFGAENKYKENSLTNLEKVLSEIQDLELAINQFKDENRII